VAVVPALGATTPVAAPYEARHRQELGLQRRFPELLGLLATSNRRGLSLSRSLDIVGDSMSGRLADELRRLRNDIRWNSDLPRAFEALGDRLHSPTLTRTVDLIAEGSQVTSDLHLVLEVAARDISERARLERERRQALQSYLVIVVVGFLVYLLVVLLLASNFLDPIETVGESVAASDAETGPLSPETVPVSELRMLLFHSALIQGFGSGVLAGKLAENSLYSGLKYGIALLVLTVVVFTLT
jgi:flagellar protein FlaJ